MAKEEKKRIKILKQTVACKQIARVGDVIEVPAGEASFLIGAKMAEESEDKLKKSEKPVPSKGKAPAAPVQGKPGQPESTPPAGGESK